MKIAIFGAAGFIGTNLTYKLLDNSQNELVLFDKDLSTYSSFEKADKLKIVEGDFSSPQDYDEFLENQDLVFHLISSTVPASKGIGLVQEIQENVINTIYLLDTCIKRHVKRVIFLSSGGTVYGKDYTEPFREEQKTNPISSYGLQKVTIENLLYLYHYSYGLDYKIVRLSNPYGPYQRPNGNIGVVTNFIYQALCGDKLLVYGNGNVVRDFIFIDDAITGILNIAQDSSHVNVYNLGSGIGVSINDILAEIQKVLNISANVVYVDEREVDVPVSILNIERYKNKFFHEEMIDLRNGIIKTSDYIKRIYNL